MTHKYGGSRKADAMRGKGHYGGDFKVHQPQSKRCVSCRRQMLTPHKTFRDGSTSYWCRSCWEAKSAEDVARYGAAFSATVGLVTTE